jgi:hypothetical protein
MTPKQFMQIHSLYHDELDEAIWVHFHRRCIITRCCVKVMISQAIIRRLRHVHTFTTTPTTTSVRVNVRWTRMEWYNGERGSNVEDLASMIGMWVDGRFDTVSVRVQRLCCDGWIYFMIVIATREKDVVNPLPTRCGTVDSFSWK